MTTKAELETNVKSAEQALNSAKAALTAFEDSPENNVFETLDLANARVENKLERKASDDCEGSHNCGQDQYTQEFIVAGVHYLGTLDVEYNRHDKTYYYVDGSKYSFKAL